MAQKNGIKHLGKEVAVIGSTVTTCNDIGARDNSTILAMGASMPMPVIINPKNMKEYQEERAKQNPKKPEFTAAGDDPLPEADPQFFFTVHSAWCPYKKSGNVTVELKRPELSNPAWQDQDGKGTDKGLVGEALKMAVSCNADVDEGAYITFRVYSEGANTARKDTIIDEVTVKNESGTASAEWAYHYKHDPEKPLAEKPQFFFTAKGKRCNEAKSGNAEIGMGIDIPVYFDDGECAGGLEYTLTGSDGAEENAKTDKDGRMQNRAFIPGTYKVNIKSENYKMPESKGAVFDLSRLDEDCKKIIVSFEEADILLKLRPEQKYAVILNRKNSNESV